MENSSNQREFTYSKSMHTFDKNHILYGEIIFISLQPFPKLRKNIKPVIFLFKIPKFIAIVIKYTIFKDIQYTKNKNKGLSVLVSGFAQYSLVFVLEFLTPQLNICAFQCQHIYSYIQYLIFINFQKIHCIWCKFSTF